MLNSVNLRKTGQRWEFESEAALEDFVWANLKKLLGLTPLKRQHRVNGQICAIIATDENKRLVVLELKNGEDRGIVQQLTRYYDALLEEKPFKEAIDYEQPVCLVAITPSFHKDNLTDRKYHNLSFQLLGFAIIQDNKNFHLQLKDIDTGKVSQVEIPHSERDSTDNIPSPPRAFLNLLARCSADEQDAILRIREKILKFDRRMKETLDAGSINYGRGKSKPCAELRFDSVRNSSALFLWLPLIIQGFKRRKITARIRIWTDWEKVSDVGHVPKALGRMINRSEWQLGTARPLNKLLPRSIYFKNPYMNSESYREKYIKSYRDDESYKSGLAMNITYYMKIIEKTEDSNSLNTLVDMALEKWLERL